MGSSVLVLLPYIDALTIQHGKGGISNVLPAEVRHFIRTVCSSKLSRAPLLVTSPRWNLSSNGLMTASKGEPGTPPYL